MQNKFLLIAIGTIIVAVLLLVISLVPVRAIVQQLPHGSVRNRWGALLSLIFMFISGYILYSFHLFLHRPDSVKSIASLVVPGIFLGGAIFVFMVCSLSLETAIDLRRIFLLEQEIITDPLMGIYNRRYLDRRLTEEIQRARRYDVPFSVFLLDIDFFKKINDTYGHQIGDMVLKKLATVIIDSVRELDIVIRYGGEEILVILPNVRVSNAVELAHRLRQKVEETMLLEPDLRKDQPAIYVTVSIGVAGYRFSADLDTASGVVERADKALYQAKNQGRNRVIANDDSMS
jgi:diguanylate cyclase (GGDEF)-like protein